MNKKDSDSGRMGDKNPFEKFTGKLVKSFNVIRLEVVSDTYDRIPRNTAFLILDTNDTGIWIEGHNSVTIGCGLKVLTAEGVFETQEVYLDSLTIVGGTEDEKSNVNDC